MSRKIKVCLSVCLLLGFQKLKGFDRGNNRISLFYVESPDFFSCVARFSFTRGWQVCCCNLHFKARMPLLAFLQNQECQTWNFKLRYVTLLCSHHKAFGQGTLNPPLTCTTCLPFRTVAVIGSTLILRGVSYRCQSP